MNRDVIVALNYISSTSALLAHKMERGVSPKDLNLDLSRMREQLNVVEQEAKDRAWRQAGGN